MVPETKQLVPEYFQKVEDFATDSEDDSALIVELVNVGCKFQAFKKETSLVLQAVDLNSKDFSLVLAEILLKPKSFIYVETHCLTNKGIKRLNALLEDIKRLFDDRLWIILLSQKGSSGKFSNVIEKEFDLNNISTKRSQEEDQRGNEDKKRSKISKNEICTTEHHDAVTISNFEQQIVDLKSLVESEKVEHVKINSILTHNAHDLKNKLEELEDVNLSLLEDIKGWKVKAEDCDKDRQGLREENEKHLQEILMFKDKFRDLKAKLTESDKERHCLIEENEKLMKCMQVCKEETEKYSDLNGKLKDCEKKRLSLRQENEKLLQEINVCKANTENPKDVEMKEQFLLKGLEERDQELKQLKDESNISKSVIEELRGLKEGLLEKIKLLQVNKICPLSTSESSCQTKSVTVSDSPLTCIVGKIDAFKDKFPDARACELLNRSIKNLKCNTSFIRTEDKVQCRIKIDVGKGLMDHKDLLVTVSTAVLDDNLAKDDAYNLLLTKLIELESET